MTACSACLFLDAVRDCPRCFRAVCADCMTTHICAEPPGVRRG